MKISIAIPTRSRATYLKGCLESVLIAAELATCPVEIIVSDNVSTDDTEQVVKSFSSDRIVYSKQKNRVSMRQNFEDALSLTTGSHVIFIGDDDGVLPNGFRVLQEVINAHGSDIIKWRTLNFKWPNDEIQVPGHLVIRARKLSGRIRKINPAKIKARFFNGKHGNYSDGGMIYHGCVSRELIDRVKALSGGTYFWCSMPDVYTAMANILASQTDILKIDRPISIGGASPRSNGDSSVKLAQTGDAAGAKEIMSFIDEAKADPCRTVVSDHCMSIELHSLAALELACKMQGVPFLINKKNWQRRVEKEMSAFASKALPACEDYFLHIFGTQITTESTEKSNPLILTSPLDREKHSMVDAPRSVKHRLLKTTVSGGVEMSDIVNAAKLLDELVGNADLDKAINPAFFMVDIMRLQKKLGALAT